MRDGEFVLKVSGLRIEEKSFGYNDWCKVEGVGHRDDLGLGLRESGIRAKALRMRDWG